MGVEVGVGIFVGEGVTDNKLPCGFLTTKNKTVKADITVKDSNNKTNFCIVVFYQII